MALLSRILPRFPFDKKEQIAGTPTFYLVETPDGLQGILGAVDPASLRSLQRSPKKAQEIAGEVFHAIYWNQNKLPGLQVTEHAEWKGARIIEIRPESCSAVQEYFSTLDFFVVGGEARLQAIIERGAKSVPVALWNGVDPKVPWLPCHRVVRSVDWFQSGWMVCLAREHMFFRDVTAEMTSVSGNGLPYDAETAETLMRRKDNEGVVMLAVSKDGAWRIHSEPGWADGLLESLHPSLREIAVVQLQEIVLPRGLGVSEGDATENNQIEVVHDAGEALERLQNGAQVAYFLSPLGSAQLKELIKHGQMLPANSVALDVNALEVWKDAK